MPVGVGVLVTLAEPTRRAEQVAEVMAATQAPQAQPILAAVAAGAMRLHRQLMVALGVPAS